MKRSGRDRLVGFLQRFGGSVAHAVALPTLIDEVEEDAARLGAHAAATAIRAEFERLLTEDSPSADRRRKDYNQAIFDKERGFAIWTSTDLGMVMDKLDKAIKNLEEK